MFNDLPTHVPVMPATTRIVLRRYIACGVPKFLNTQSSIKKKSQRYILNLIRSIHWVRNIMVNICAIRGKEKSSPGNFYFNTYVSAAYNSDKRINYYIDQINNKNIIFRKITCILTQVK